VRRPTVDPALTFGVGLALSVVLWYPTLRQTMNGDVEITDSAIRYLLTLALAWAGVFGVSSVVALRARRRAPSPPPPDSRPHAAAPSAQTTEPRPASQSASHAVDSDAA
jgi:hypothetical protein